MFNSSQMEYILAIDEAKSLSKAAEKLYLSQSALSQQLANLSQQGLPPLFTYENGQMTATVAGKLYLNGARTILKLKSEFMQSLAEQKARESAGSTEHESIS